MNDQELTDQLHRLGQTPFAAPDYLTARILANVRPREPLERLLAWFGAAPWRGALAALLPLVLGISLGAGDVEQQETWVEAEELVFVDTLAEYGDDEI